ncbi:MAG TPA: NADH-quinone oxidoreductase subunit H, partial [Nitrospiria bacterium]|nr:NADH-quinone oxidoreductase subunit H [Nitrospiria bacterium]
MQIGSVLFQSVLLFGLAPLVGGVIKKMKARFQSRRGPSVLQPYRDLIKRFRKHSVVSEHASWIFRATPYIVFGSVAAAASLVPTYTSRLPLGFAGDVIALVYLFALARFFTALAGLEAGSAFGGMGSSREMVVSALAEPSMMLAVFSVALTARSISLGPAVEGLAKSGLDLLNPAHLLAFGALFVVALAENGRIPVDNPDTHLELTMIHEGMILEYSGRGLALIEWASTAKQMIFLSLLGNLFIPMGMTMRDGIPLLLLALSIFFLKMLLLAAAIAVIESSLAKLRFFRVPELLGASFVLSLAA